jgi:hypothetical protein
MMMRFLIIIGIIILAGMCHARGEEAIQLIDPYVEDLEDPPIVLLPDGDKPVVFPEPMAKAAVVVEQIVTDIFCPTCLAEEDAWRAGIMAFLNDSQNLTRINLTA